MITATPIPGFTFDKLAYPDLVARFLAIPGWTAEHLGLSTGGHDMYAFTYGDLSKPVIHVEGNIHGLHEWRTCYWVSEFMRYLHDPSGLAPDTAAAIEDLKSRYSFSFIPACNPDGYVQNIYQNSNLVNLNRNFDYFWAYGPSDPTHPQYRGPAAFSEVETQYIRDRVRQLRPVGFLDCHTWSAEQQGFTTLPPLVEDQVNPVREYHENVMRAVGMWPDGNAPQTPMGAMGLAGYWGAVTPSSVGTAPLSVTFESGGGWPVEQQSHVGMTAILYYMLAVDAYVGVPPAPFSLAEVSDWGPIRVSGYDQPVTSVSYVQDGAPRRIWP